MLEDMPGPAMARNISRICITEFKKMAINPELQYPGKISPGDADYPYGSARNVTTPGDGTGTPWEAAIVNDWIGFFQTMLTKTGIVPSGTPDNVNASQYYQALEEFIKSSDFIDFVGRFDVGDRGTATNSSDPVVNVNRNVDDSAAGVNGHCFSDSSLVDRSGGVSYASYDARFDVEGTESYGHFAPFQNGMVYNSSGNTSIMYGFVDVPRYTAGTVGTRYGAYISDVPLSGGAALTSNFGVYVPELTAGTAQNFAIVTKGATKSIFEGEVIFQGNINVTPKVTADALEVNGNVVIDQTLTVQDVTSLVGGGWVIDGSDAAGLRLAAGVGSTYDYSLMKQDLSAFIQTVPTGTDAVKFWGNVSFNGADPLPKPTVTGSKGGNAALTSLISALAAYGLITDSTT